MFRALGRSARRAIGETKPHGKSRQYQYGDLVSALRDMNLHERKQLFGITWGVPGAGNWEYATKFGTGQSLAPAGVLSQHYRQHPNIATAIEILSDDAASIPWEFRRVENGEMTEEIVKDNQVLDLWRRPNPLMPGNQLFSATYIHDNLDGEVFWYYPDYVLPREGAPEGIKSLAGGDLWIIPSAVIEHEFSEDGRSILWFQRVNSRRVPLDVDKLTQFKRYNPYDPVRGLTKIESIELEAQGDYHASLWNKRFFDEGNAVPAGLLIPDVEVYEQTDDDQRRELLDEFNSKHGGTKRRIGMLPGGFAYEDVGKTQKEMDFREGRDYNREQIFSRFGIPPFRAGVLDKANYANSRAQDEVYWFGTIERFLGRVASTINFDFFPKVGIKDVRVVPNWAAVKAMLDNMTDKAVTGTKLWQMGVPLEKINTRLELGFDLEGVEGADRSVWPGNMIPAEMADEYASQANSPGQTTNEDDAKTPKEPKDDDEGGKVIQFRSYPTNDEWREQKWQRVIMQMRDIEARFHKRLRAYFHSIEKETLANLHSLKGWTAYEQKGELRRKASIEQIIFNLAAANNKLMRLATPIQRDAMQRGGDNLMADLGVAISFDMDNPIARAKLAEITLKLTGINVRLEQRIREVLLAGFDEGATLEELAKSLTGEFELPLKRSKMIARTETGVALNVSRHLAMRQAGIKKHQWLSARDPDVRETHVMEDGSTVIIGTAFPKTKMLYPQDPSGPAREVIACRCVALPVTK